MFSNCGSPFLFEDGIVHNEVGISVSFIRCLRFCIRNNWQIDKNIFQAI